MQRCYYCGKELHEIPFTCRRCGNIFCADHHLPENHNCTLHYRSFRSRRDRTPLPKTTGLHKWKKPDIPSYNRPQKHYKVKRFLRKIGRGIKNVIIAGAIILFIGFFAILAFSSLFSNYSAFMGIHNPLADALKPAFSLPTETTINKSKENLGYINGIRSSYGKSPLNFDIRIFNLAKARASDMEQYGYFDHTNPNTGTCAYSMKSSFGFNSDEYVAENAYESQISIDYGTPQARAYYDGIENAAVDSWLTDRGHRYNLLYSDHISGAVYCSQNSMCVFLGLNHEHFSDGCHTVAEGFAFWNRVGQQPGEV